MTTKIEYQIDLARPVEAADGESPYIRSVTPDDLEGLARLMLNSYMGTIDYEGEDLDDARAEVGWFLQAEGSLLDRSYVIDEDGEIVSGILISAVDGSPFIGYVMTLASHKEKGLARLLTVHALQRLADDGHETVTLFITEGNLASERLFESVGAVRVEGDS